MEKKLKVIVMSNTDSLLALIDTAARNCYSDKEIDELEVESDC
jgi:hypothetical protein